MERTGPYGSLFGSELGIVGPVPVYWPFGRAEDRAIMTASPPGSEWIDLAEKGFREYGQLRRDHVWHTRYPPFLGVS